LLRGWKKKANKDLWEELDELNEGLDINYIWVKGHDKNYWNNECDKIAQKESLAAQKKVSEENFTSNKIIKKKNTKSQQQLFD
jgi:ribonuclease HI